jgi:cytochrome P450
MIANETAMTFASLQEHYRAPHAHYDALRAFDPVYYDRTARSWLVTGRKAITRVLADHRFVSHLPGAPLSLDPTGQAMPSLRSLIAGQLLFFTGAAHTRAHAAVQGALGTLLNTQGMHRYIAGIIGERLSQAKASGEMEVVADLAWPVAGYTSAHILGLPVDQGDLLRQWSEWSTAFTDRTSGFGQAPTLPIYQLQHAFLELIARRRGERSAASAAAPLPDGALDLLDALLAAPESFPHDQFVATNMQMLFSAGRVTSQKAIAEGVRRLSMEPGLWQRLRSQAPSDTKLASRLADEWLRLITPTRFLKRWASEDVDLSGEFPGPHLIRRGQEVVLYLEAGNRDPQEFTAPHLCDPQRRPNRHIAFGYGPHLCPGAGLARLELRLVIEALLAQLDHLAPLGGVDELYEPNPNLGGVRSYRVAVG